MSEHAERVERIRDDDSIQMFAMRLSLATGVLMLAGKWFGFVLTGSDAILSDASESLVHILAVAFAFFSLILARRPADASHPYGHDRIAFFSAGTEGALIVVAALYIIYEAVDSLIAGPTLRNLDTGALIILGASVVNLALGLYLVWTGRRTHSIILVANGKHVLTDSWTSFGVVAGLGLTLLTGWIVLDPIVAILVATNIMWTGGKLLRESVGGLMDEGDVSLESSLRDVLDRETQERGLMYHELRYRRSGRLVWIEFHLLFPPGTLLADAHRHATDIEMRLTDTLPSPSRIISHLETRDEHDDHHVDPLRHG